MSRAGLAEEGLDVVGRGGEMICRGGGVPEIDTIGVTDEDGNNCEVCGGALVDVPPTGGRGETALALPSNRLFHLSLRL